MAASSSKLPDIRIRPPTSEDGPVLWELAKQTGLALNSHYAYLLVGTHWAATSAIAERAGKAMGFVSGYRPPTHDDTWFCWQVGVTEEARGHGLARQMIFDLLARDACQGVHWIEATVTPSNKASDRLFASIARILGAEDTVRPYFSAEMFPGYDEGEDLHRIGPFERRRVEGGA